MKKLDSQYGSDGGGSIHPILMGQAETVWERWRKSEPLLHQSVSYIRNLKKSHQPSPTDVSKLALHLFDTRYSLDNDQKCTTAAPN